MTTVDRAGWKCGLCHCELSGEVHVIFPGTGCELCRPENLHEMTAENVRKALRFAHGHSPEGIEWRR